MRSIHPQSGRAARVTPTTPVATTADRGHRQVQPVRRTSQRGWRPRPATTARTSLTSGTDRGCEFTLCSCYATTLVRPRRTAGGAKGRLVHELISSGTTAGMSGTVHGITIVGLHPRRLRWRVRQDHAQRQCLESLACFPPVDTTLQESGADGSTLRLTTGSGGQSSAERERQQ